MAHSYVKTDTAAQREPGHGNGQQATAAPVRERGKETPEHFFPDFLFKEALVALVGFVLLTLIVVYLKLPLERVADPTDNAYVPRPEWYFLFLFQMLKYFPGQWEPIATVALPGGFIALMVALPFIDRKPHRTGGIRALPAVAAGGMVAFMVLLTLLAVRSTPTTAESGVQDNRQLTPAQSAGQQLFTSLKCTACHTLDGQGGNTAPDLTQVGARHDVQWLHTFLEDPKSVNPNAVMKPYLGELTHQEIENLAQYLASFK